MTVANQHKDYTRMFSQWQRCRDTSSGQTAIHNGGDRYLPRLSDQTAPEYASYKLRASYYNAVWRTISGLQGMLFRKPAIVEVPAVMEPMMNDVSLSGKSLHMFMVEVVEECLTVGRVGIFVDFPTVGNGVTAADAKLQNLRPLLKRYTAESIINWRNSVVNNVCALSMVVLAEEVEDCTDEFSPVFRKQYRVLDKSIYDHGDGKTELAYRVRIFSVDEKGEDVLNSVTFPKVNGKLLTSIPFYFIGVDSCDSDIDEPPLIDLVDLNLAHYRVNADYEHGCHFTGLPTPVLTGYTPDAGQTFSIGSTTAWVFPRADAKATYLEFTGAGLESLEKNLNRKEQQMAVLGARMLESKQNTGDSADSKTINMGGEQSLLASMAHSISRGVASALTTFAHFAGSNEGAKYAMNKDFFPMPMSPLQITALVASWQNGGISYETLFENLQRGEIVDIDKTIEQEIAKMDQHKPVIPGGTQVNQTNSPTHEVTAPTQRQLQTPPK